MNDTSRHRGDFADTFETAFARLRVRVEHARLSQPSADWPAQVAAAIRATFEFVATSPNAANCLTGEALARGPEGYARYDQMLITFSECLRSGRALRTGSDMPKILERALVGGLATLIAQRLDRGCEDELPALAPEAIQFVLTPYLGTDRAKHIAFNPPPGSIS